MSTRYDPHRTGVGAGGVLAGYAAWRHWQATSDPATAARAGGRGFLYGYAAAWAVYSVGLALLFLVTISAGLGLSLEAGEDRGVIRYPESVCILRGERCSDGGGEDRGAIDLSRYTIERSTTGSGPGTGPPMLVPRDRYTRGEEQAIAVGAFSLVLYVAAVGYAFLGGLVPLARLAWWDVRGDQYRTVPRPTTRSAGWLTVITWGVPAVAIGACLSLNAVAFELGAPA